MLWLVTPCLVLAVVVVDIRLDRIESVSTFILVKPHMLETHLCCLYTIVYPDVGCDFHILQSQPLKHSFLGLYDFALNSIICIMWHPVLRIIVAAVANNVN